MRDPERIKRILEKLEKYWKANPDLRLGQIVFNINYHITQSNDCFYLEDDKFERELDKIISEEVEKNGGNKN